MSLDVDGFTFWWVLACHFVKNHPAMHSGDESIEVFSPFSPSCKNNFKAAYRSLWTPESSRCWADQSPQHCKAFGSWAMVGRIKLKAKNPKTSTGERLFWAHGIEWGLYAFAYAFVTPKLFFCVIGKQKLFCVPWSTLLTCAQVHRSVRKTSAELFALQASASSTYQHLRSKQVQYCDRFIGR